MSKAKKKDEQFVRPGRVQSVNNEPSLTKQSFREESDINVIVGRFVKSGHMPPPNSKPQYGISPDQDFFESACITAASASALEDGLPITTPESDELVLDESTTPPEPEKSSDQDETSDQEDQPEISKETA